MLRPILRKGRHRIGGGGRGRTITDLFVIVGQSNAQGHGDSTLSPASPTGRYFDGTSMQPLADPVGGAVTGSMWPAFANQWFTQTGHRACFIEQATGSTALLAAADTGSGNWSPTGTLRAAAATAANAAIAGIEGMLGYTLGSVYFVWAQGEQEAENMDGISFTGEDYRAALVALSEYFKAQVPEMVEMLVVQSARNGVTGGDAEWWAAIRKAQEDACTDGALLRMACTAAMSMTYRVPQWMDDGVHYDQNALNQIGAMGATEAASPNVSAFAPSPVVTVSNYSGAAVGSRTIAHTCGAACKSIILASGFGKTSSATASVTGITFGGKAFRKVQVAGSGWGSVPASASSASIWILDEDDYAASLANASGDIVVTYSSAVAIIASLTIIESAEALVIESHDWENDSGGAVVNIDTLNYANSPALMVTCVSGRIDSVTPATFSFSSGTEATDYGYNLDTRSYSVATAYEVLASPTYGTTVTATPSASMIHAGIVSASFRRRFNGETDVA